MSSYFVSNAVIDGYALKTQAVAVAVLGSLLVFAFVLLASAKKKELCSSGSVYACLLSVETAYCVPCL